MPTSVQVVSRPPIRSVTSSPIPRSGSSPSRFAVATSALPSPGRSQRPCITTGRTVVAPSGRPKVTRAGLSEPSGRIRWALANRHGSATVTPGTARASATTVEALAGSVSSTWTS